MQDRSLKTNNPEYGQRVGKLCETKDTGASSTEMPRDEFEEWPGRNTTGCQKFDPGAQQDSTQSTQREDTSQK